MKLGLNDFDRMKKHELWSTTWTSYYAWFPTRLDTGQYVWLCHISRKPKSRKEEGGWNYHYRDPAESPEY